MLSDNAKTEDSLEPYCKLWNGPFISAGGFSNSIEQVYKLAEKPRKFSRIFIVNILQGAQ